MSAEPEERLSAIFEMAHSKFGVPCTVEPSDVLADSELTSSRSAAVQGGGEAALVAYLGSLRTKIARGMLVSGRQGKLRERDRQYAGHFQSSAGVADTLRGCFERIPGAQRITELLPTTPSADHSRSTTPAVAPRPQERLASLVVNPVSEAEFDVEDISAVHGYSV